MKSMKNNEVGKTFRTTHNKKLNKKLYSRVYSILVRKKMVKNNLKMDLLKHLLEDPTTSVNKLAKKFNTYRRRVWQKKKELEDDDVIWGYTAVIDESKIGQVLYIALFRIKPISKNFVDLIIERLATGAPSKDGVRVIDVLYINGYYDVIVRFSAPDHTTARRYYETLRIVYSDYFLGESLLCDVNFSMVRMGKLNPGLEKLYDFVPKIRD